MAVRRVVTILAAAVLAVGFSGLATAQTKSKSDAPKAAPPKAAPKAPAKSAAKHAAAGSEEPTLVGQFGAWGAYVAAPSGKKVCFVLAKPSSSKTNPANRPRDPAYAFISTRPAEKVVNEVSIMIGYPLKPGSDPTMEIGSAKFDMYAQGDGLWIKNAAEEGRLVDALRKGADVTVKGESSRGTQTTDVFSLKGLTQALDKLGQECGK